MNFSRLTRASDWEVKEWLEKELQLTSYQKSKIHKEETIRFSPFYFYKSKKQQNSALWRLSLWVWPIYWLICFTGLPFAFLFTGKWGYGKKFQDFHYNWLSKLGL